jgi:hypothetical protein
MLPPYTMLDEYNAVGVIIASMMRWPTFWEGDSHFRDLGLRRQSQPGSWKYHFEASPYTGALKNMVHLLISKKDTERLSTWNLYRKAARGFESYYSTRNKSYDLNMSDGVRFLHHQELLREQGDENAMVDHANRVYESHQTSLRFAEPEEPDELEELLRQVNVECTRAKEARYETSAPA